MKDSNINEIIGYQHTKTTITTMENKKTFWEVIKGSLSGTDGEGSAKRLCMAFFCLCLIMPSKIVYLICFYAASIAPAPTVIQVAIVKMYQPLNWTEQLSLWMFAGLATFEGVSNLVKWFRGGKTEEKKNDA